MQSTAMELLSASPHTVPVQTVPSVPGDSSSGAAFGLGAKPSPPPRVQFGELIKGLLKTARQQKQGELTVLQGPSSEPAAAGVHFLGVEEKGPKLVFEEKIEKSLEPGVVAEGPDGLKGQSLSIQAASVPPVSTQPNSTQPTSIPLASPPECLEEPYVDPKSSLLPLVIAEPDIKIPVALVKKEPELAGKPALHGEMKKNESLKAKADAQPEDKKPDTTVNHPPLIQSDVSKMGVTVNLIQPQETVVVAPHKEIPRAIESKELSVVPKTGLAASAQTDHGMLPETKPPALHSAPKVEEENSSESQAGSNDKTGVFEGKNIPTAAALAGGVGSNAITTPTSGDPLSQDGRTMPAHRDIPIVAMQNTSPGIGNLSNEIDYTRSDPTARAVYDAGQGRQAEQQISGSSNALEVGMNHGTHGWLRVRAEMNDGTVMASIASSTIGGREMLHRELPSLSLFLQEERVGLGELVVKDASDQIATGSGDGGAMQRDERPSHQNPSRADTGSEGLVASGVYDEELTEEGSLPTAVSASLNMTLTVGSWLNVRA